MLGLGLGIGLGLGRGFNALSALAPGAAILAAWRPSRIDTLFQDRAGTIPVTAAGQTVGFIRDATGGVNHLTAISDTTRGIYRIDAGGRPYIEHDLVDDGYSSPSMNPGVDKVQVFAAIRKLTDPASFPILIETSPTWASNAGSLVICATNNLPGTYLGGTRGSGVATPIGATGFAAPITNAICMTGDIAGDLTTFRVNGVQAGQSTADQGTGTFGNYQTFVGNRSGGGLPFGGHLYDLVLRFSSANLNDATLVAVEREIGAKAGLAW